MEVIPVINCADAECVRQKIEAAKTFLPEGNFLHLDVTDGVFATHETWNDPAGWIGMAPPFGLEVHLMVGHPEKYAESWLGAGAKRLIVHVETLGDFAVGPKDEGNESILKELLQKCAAHGADLMLALRPETPVEAFEPFLGAGNSFAFQVLAVHPGPAAQEFLPEALKKTKAVRSLVGANAIIEVDGGMNTLTARLVKDAGASAIVSASYIFNSADPNRAYQELCGI